MCHLSVVVCSTRLLRMPMVPGGNGVIVQIDESLFRHKPKVSSHYFIIFIIIYIEFRITGEDLQQMTCESLGW